MKQIEKAESKYDGLRSVADAMHLKANIKEEELRLKCISQLLEGSIKIELLIMFLNTVRKDGKEISESSIEDGDRKRTELQGFLGLRPP